MDFGSMEIGKCKAYERLEERDLEDIKSKGCLLRHKKSGARICLISNEDENKVFSIGFRLWTARGLRISWSIRCSAGRRNSR
jgi:hypothetical protein